MEKIGYIDKNSLALKNELNLVDKLKDVEIQYGYRDVVEERIDVVQPICAGVIITKDKQILIISKSSKSTGNSSPEKNKTLLYVGGHLDFSDKTNSNIETFTNGMKREIFEELGINLIDVNINEPIVTYTATNEKSAKHLGVIFPIIIEKSFDTTFADGKCRFVNFKDLDDITNFESWSKIIINEVIRKINKIKK